MSTASLNSDKPHEGSIKNWLFDHDDRWSFILLYVGGAIILSVFASLFWVGLLMLLHMVLEYVVHRMAGIKYAFLHMLWETKLDIALFFFAFVIAVYSDTIFAALGAGSAVRGGAHAVRAARGAQIATRFGIIQRSLRVFFLAVDDVIKFILTIIRTLGRKKAPATSESSTLIQEATEHYIRIPAPWNNIGGGDWFSIGFGVICLTLVLIAPLITDLTVADTISEILQELQP